MLVWILAFDIEILKMLSKGRVTIVLAHLLVGGKGGKILGL